MTGAVVAAVLVLVGGDGELLGSGPATPLASGGESPEIRVSAVDTLPGADLLDGSRMHVLVVVESSSSTTGTLHRMERREDGWRTADPPAPVVVGRSGVGAKREGDGRSPAGIFPLGPAFGYAPEPPGSAEWPYRPMTPSAVCVDDPASEHYARIVDPDEVDAPDWSSAEVMRRDLAHGDDLYRWGVVVEYNRERRPGAGSCIFLHVWRGADRPTAGCTAMPEGRLLELLSHLDPADRPLLVQGTRSELESLRGAGLLPYSVPESTPP